MTAFPESIMAKTINGRTPLHLAMVRHKGGVITSSNKAVIFCLANIYTCLRPLRGRPTLTGHLARKLCVSFWIRGIISVLLKRWTMPDNYRSTPWLSHRRTNIDSRPRAGSVIPHAGACRCASRIVPRRLQSSCWPSRPCLSGSVTQL